MWQDIKNIYHLGIAVLANIFYEFPSKKLRVIGVTGTDGKTTTASLIYHILNSAGYNASMVTSVGAVINGKNYDVGFHVTTPSSFAIQEFMRNTFDSSGGPVRSFPPASAPSKSSVRAVGSPFSSATPFLILETTSHALDQYRVFGIKFEVGVLTNVTHEHLDYHKTYENYVKTKFKLLQSAKIAITNRDDESYELISKLKSQNSKLQLKTQKFITYGIKDGADINPENFPFKTKLIGEFNKYNVLAAISACRALGIRDVVIRKGIGSFVAPFGRTDTVYKKDFTVMIDFAHTPNAFDQILKSVRPMAEGRLIHVFGAAGLRDISKRPIMGEISSQYADVIILTSEDPRSESVDKIIGEIESGIINPKFEIRNSKQIQIFKIPNRQRAIEKAIKMAEKDDFVLITGKSHEKSMNYGHGEIPWDEYRVVRDALKQFNNLTI